MVDNILAEEKPKTIKLADGKDYILPAIDLTTLANIEKSLGFGLRLLPQKFETETFQLLQSLSYALLRENYPQITREEAGRLVGLNEFPQMVSEFSRLLALVASA